MVGARAEHPRRERLFTTVFKVRNVQPPPPAELADSVLVVDDNATIGPLCATS
jgi:hypothetical protein